MKLDLDVRGKICPVPLLETKKKLQELKSGDVLEVLTDYEPATRTITLMAGKKGYTAEIEKKNSDYLIRILVK